MRPNFSQIAELFALAPVSSEGSRHASAEGKTAQESERLGRASLTDGEYEQAISHFRKALEQRGDEPVHDILLDLGGAYEYSDQALQAYRQYLKAVKARSDNPEPLIGIAALHKRHGRSRDAISHLEDALRIDPENPHVFFKLAEGLRDLGERTRAVAAILASIQLKPEEPFYHYWLGDLLVSMRRDEEALEAFRAAIELSPGDDYLYLRVSVPFWRTGRRVEAVKSIRLASDLDPDKNLYHGLLEALLSEMGQASDADLESDRADQMDRFDEDMLARILAEMGEA